MWAKCQVPSHKALLRAGVLVSSSCTLSNNLVTSTQTLPLSFALSLSHSSLSPRGGAERTSLLIRLPSERNDAHRNGRRWCRRSTVHPCVHRAESTKVWVTEKPAEPEGEARKERFGPLWLENLRRCLKLMFS